MVTNKAKRKVTTVPAVGGHLSAGVAAATTGCSTLAAGDEATTSPTAGADEPAVATAPAAAAAPAVAAAPAAVVAKKPPPPDVVVPTHRSARAAAASAMARSTPASGDEGSEDSEYKAVASEDSESDEVFAAAKGKPNPGGTGKKLQH
jgi:hypothetical protein